MKQQSSNAIVTTIEQSAINQQYVKVIEQARKVEQELTKNKPVNLRPALIALPSFGGLQLATTLMILQAVRQSQTVKDAERSNHFVLKMVGGNKVYKPILDDKNKPALSKHSNLPMFETIIDGGTAKYVKETIVKAERVSSEAWLQCVKVPFLASEEKFRLTVGQAIQVLQTIALPKLLKGENLCKNMTSLYAVLNTVIDGKEASIYTYNVANNEVSAKYLRAATYKGKTEAEVEEIWNNFAKDIFDSFKNAVMTNVGLTLNEKYRALVELPATVK